MPTSRSMPAVPNDHGSIGVDDVEILTTQDGHLGKQSCRYLLRCGERHFVVAVVGLIADPHDLESTWWADVTEVALDRSERFDQPLFQAGLSAESRQAAFAGATELIRRLGRLTLSRSGNMEPSHGRESLGELLGSTIPLQIEQDLA